MSRVVFTRGRATDTTPVPVRTESVRVGLIAAVSGWLIRRLAGAVAVTVRTPLLLAGVLVFTGLMILRSWAGPVPALIVFLLIIGALVGWRLRWSASFTLILGNRARSLGRWFWTYRRRWQPAMITANLAQHRDGEEFLPQLVSVRSSRWVDRVRVRLLPGQTLHDWADMAHRLAQSFAVASCRIHSTSNVQVIEVWALRRDPLTDPVRPVVPNRLNLIGLEVGRAEDGTAFLLVLLGHHILVVGATGSGKGSVIWSLITQLAAGLIDRSVWLWVIDPKGGMELAPGQAPYDRFAHGSASTDADGVGLWEEDFAALLEDAVAVMRERQDRLRGVTCLHQPTPDDPLIVIVIDELASLTAYVSDPGLRKRIDAACRCCCPKAARSASRSSQQCRIPARTPFRSGTCFRPGSAYGSPRPSTSR